MQRKICSFKKTTNQSTFKVSVWQRSTKSTSYEIFNLGNNKPQELMTLIHILEKALGKKAIIEFQPMQPGDVLETCADLSKSSSLLNYHPTTSLEQGLPTFAKWFQEFFQRV